MHFDKTIGPIGVDVRYLKSLKTGLTVALWNQGLPISHAHIPDGWRLKAKSWPTSWRRPSGYRLTFWEQSLRTFRVTIRPTGECWSVEVADEAREGERGVVGFGLAFQAAVDRAIETMEAINRGERIAFESPARSDA